MLTMQCRQHRTRLAVSGLAQAIGKQPYCPPAADIVVGDALCAMLQVLPRAKIEIDALKNGPQESKRTALSGATSATSASVKLQLSTANVRRSRRQASSSARRNA